MYLLFLSLIYFGWRLSNLHSRLFLISMVLSLVTVALVLRAETGANAARVAPFNFDRVHPEWVAYFFLIHFVWAWLLLIVWAKFYGVHTVSDLKAAARAGKTIPVEFVFITIIGGLLPYLLLFFDSGAWVYFTSFHAVIAGAFVVALQTDITWGRFISRMRDGTLAVSALLLAAVCLIVAAHAGVATLSSTYRMLKRNGEIRAVLGGRPLSDWRQGVKQVTKRGSFEGQTLEPASQVVDCLEEISRRPVRQRRAMLLYVPKTNRSFWNMRQADAGTTPFIAPAFAAVAMVDGLPEFDDIGYSAIAWGYPQYRLPTRPEQPREHVEDAIRYATMAGYRELLVFRDVSSAGCGLEKVDLN
jgi:hypothetical protein